jgi:hypothetical protein
MDLKPKPWIDLTFKMSQKGNHFVNQDLKQWIKTLFIIKNKKNIEINKYKNTSNPMDYYY